MTIRDYLETVVLKLLESNPVVLAVELFRRSLVLDSSLLFVIFTSRFLQPFQDGACNLRVKLISVDQKGLALLYSITMRMLTHGLHEILICPFVAVDDHHVSVHAAPPWATPDATDRGARARGRHVSVLAFSPKATRADERYSSGSNPKVPEESRREVPCLLLGAYRW